MNLGRKVEGRLCHEVQTFVWLHPRMGCYVKERNTCSAGTRQAFEWGNCFYGKSHIGTHSVFFLCVTRPKQSVLSLCLGSAEVPPPHSSLPPSPSMVEKFSACRAILSMFLMGALHLVPLGTHFILCIVVPRSPFVVFSLFVLWAAFSPLLSRSFAPDYCSSLCS